MKPFNYKAFLLGLAVALVIFVSATGGAIADRLFGIKPLDALFPKSEESVGGLAQKIIKEESVVIDVVEKVSPSVVTVSIETPKRKILEFDIIEGFRSRIEGGTPQDIGTGFIVSSDGLIVTNKHVVASQGVKYNVITNDNQEYEVAEVTRDPNNDLAILKIDPSAGSGQALKPVELGTSDNLKVGQFVIAIGTALGEFRHTVTTGVISGLGRGITAGSPFRGYVERIDDVIQTDAAINPGNSGGPLLNSAGQVIGINVAVAQAAENVGFAIPVNIVNNRLDEFKSNGKFENRAFLGVGHSMISKSNAILNDVPQGAFITEVIKDSPASEAGIEVEDIVIKIDGKKLADEEGGLAEIISQKKPGDKIEMEVWRNNETLTLSATLSEFPE